MQKYQNNVTDRLGNAKSGIAVTVNYAGAGIAPIFSDAAGTVSLANPIRTDSNGYFEFYAADGTYDIVILGDQGYRGVQIVDSVTAAQLAENALTRDEAAAPDGATKVGVIAPDAGAQDRTQADKNADTIHLFEFIPKSQHAAILANTSVYDATVPLANFFAACTARKKVGIVPGGKINYQIMSFPGGFPGMRGEGSAATWFQHIAGTAGASVSRPTGRLNYPVFENILFQGYGTNTESSGIDLTGFSYSTFRTVKVSGFYGDCWTGTGYIVTAGEDRSSIENTFYDCIGGSSVTGRGFNTYAPGVAYDVAALVDWSFFGGYMVANAGGQVRARFGEKISFCETAVEASAGGLIDIDDCSSFNFRGYLESRSNNMYITVGANANNYHIVPTRWTYPLWAMVNPASVLGRGRIELAGGSPGLSCYSNTDLAKSTPAGLPVGLTTILSFTSTGYAADSASNKGVSSGFSVASGSGQCGFEVRLAGTASRYFGKRVTVRLRYRAAGNAGTSLQIRPRVASTDNTANGQFYSRALTFGAGFMDLIADVVFPAKGAFADTDVAALRFLMTTFTANVTFNIDEIDVYEGGFAYPFGNPVTDPPNPSVSTTAVLSSVTGWPNVLRKSYGRVITDEQASKIYFATGSLPASQWKEMPTAGGAGGTITPA